MRYRIETVEVIRYPIVRVTFDDGLSGEYDLSDLIADGPAYKALEDPALFAKVAVDPQGRTFGWHLDTPGHEIDFCPDATRILVETGAVHQLANRYRMSRTAAE